MPTRKTRTAANKRPALLERGRLAYALLGAACVLAGGCGPSQPYRTGERLERGLVIVLTGIEGRSSFNEAIVRGLDEGGVDWAVELYDWTSPLGPLYNLYAQDRNRDEAARLAERVSRYMWQYPDRPVVLLGQSGGGAIAVWAAENLLPGQQIEGIILLAASLSPEYFLDFALDRTRRGIVSFHSNSDWLFLGVGTTVTGTMDGRHSSSAGRVGFRQSPHDSTYDKLVQVAWSEEMARVGHSGSHLTSGASRYVARYVAPLILTKPKRGVWDGQFVTELLAASPASQPAVVSRPSSCPATEPASRPATEPASRPAGDEDFPQVRRLGQYNCAPIRQPKAQTSAEHVTQ